MPIQIVGNCSELTLIFDRPTFRCSKQQIQYLGETLSHVEGIESVETRSVWYRTPRIRVVFDAQTEPNTILRRMAVALRSLNPDFSSSGFADHLAQSERILQDASSAPTNRSAASDPTNDDPWDPSGVGPAELPAPRNRLKEAGYGFLAIGAFAMSWIGLVLPVIPTVPFVLLTAHFAVQSSPRLRNTLLRSRMFGPMMRDWQEHRAIRRVVQLQAYFFTLIIIVVGFVLAPAIPVIYGIMVIGSFMALFAISQIPVIEVLESEGSKTLPGTESPMPSNKLAPVTI